MCAPWRHVLFGPANVLQRAWTSHQPRSGDRYRYQRHTGHARWIGGESDRLKSSLRAARVRRPPSHCPAGEVTSPDTKVRTHLRKQTSQKHVGFVNTRSNGMDCSLVEIKAS